MNPPGPPHIRRSAYMPGYGSNIVDAPLPLLRATIPAELALSWESQARQYPARGPQGLQTFTVTELGLPIHCCLYRGADGALLGILNHYPVDIEPYEKAGNVNVWVHPEHRREGIGTKLVERAAARWGPFDLGQQRYTEAGLALARKLAES